MDPTCSICLCPYDTNEKIPRLLPDCGHTFCTQCLASLIAKANENNITFACPEDRTECSLKRPAVDFPKNFALVQLFSATKNTVQHTKEEQKNSPDPPGRVPESANNEPNSYTSAASLSNSSAIWEQEELCEVHKKKLEVICVDDRSKLCPHCALFGGHRTHDVRTEEEVLREIAIRAEALMEMIQHVETSNQLFRTQNTIEELHTQFKSKEKDLTEMMKNKFKEFHESLLRKEQHTMDKLKEAFKGVEDMFHIMRDSPKQLSIKTDNWRNDARGKLDSLTENGDMIAFDLLEEKSNPEKDILCRGSVIVNEINTLKEKISTESLKESLDVINIIFDQRLSSIIQTCAFVQHKGEEKEDLNALVPMHLTNQPSVDDPNEDQEDLISMSMSGLNIGDYEYLHGFSPLKKEGQMDGNARSYAEYLHHGQQNPDFQKEFLPLTVNVGDTADLSGIYLGVDGAIFVGNKLRTNTHLKSLKIARCGISDEGCFALFEGIKENQGLEVVNLSNNLISDKSSDLIAAALTQNTGLHTIYFNGNPLNFRLLKAKLLNQGKQNIQIPL